MAAGIYTQSEVKFPAAIIKFTLSISRLAIATGFLLELVRQHAPFFDRVQMRFCLPQPTWMRKRRPSEEAELEFRASGKECRYSWDYDENMDIFSA